MQVELTLSILISTTSFLVLQRFPVNVEENILKKCQLHCSLKITNYFPENSRTVLDRLDFMYRTSAKIISSENLVV